MMIIIFSILFLMVDIISKIVVINMLELGESVSIIKNFFNISYVRNTGAAFSMFSTDTWFVLIVSLVIISFIIWYIFKNKVENRIEKVGYSLILGGAFGNLLDRIIYGYVIDFLDFNFFGYKYPIFNIADIFIVVGVFIILIYTWRCNDDGNNSRRTRT